MSLSWLVAAYMAVLVSELIGDKSLVTVSAYATRYRVRNVTIGLALAFAAKSLVAVVLGRSLGRVPPNVLAAMTGVTFFMSAVAIWRRPGSASAAAPRPASQPAQATAVFASVFFTEWADIGQLTTASLAARTNALGAVWLGASLALCTKGVVAVSIGRLIGQALPERAVRGVAASVCVALGCAATVQASM